jgi:hypothetical protein
MAKKLDEMKKLSPEERIKKLKELEGERKKEIEEAEELIKETVRELSDAVEERRTPIPQAKATDESTLSTAEEKELVSTHQFWSKHERSKPDSQKENKEKSLDDFAEEEEIGVAGKESAKDQQQKGGSVYGSIDGKSGKDIYKSDVSKTVTGAGSTETGKDANDFYKKNENRSEGPGSDYQSSKTVTGAATEYERHKKLGNDGRETYQ